MIAYSGTDSDRFDRNYYCSRHIPHARRIWSRYGLLDIRAFFPAADLTQQGTICLTQCVFRDRASLTAALSAEDTRELTEDLPNFTNLAGEFGLFSPMN